MKRYKHRQEAGSVLASALSAYAGRKDVIVLALPRGGVPVGFEVAKALQAPLDVFVVRKLGVPGHEELAMGAIAMGGIRVLNDDIIRQLQVTQEEIDVETQRETAELNRRLTAYRGTQPFPLLKNKIIILVDDGIATGATMRAAINASKAQQPAKLIVAVPVAEKYLAQGFAALVDEFYCPLQPEDFYAVGAWYEDFSQTEDKEVYTLLNQARASSGAK